PRVHAHDHTARARRLRDVGARDWPAGRFAARASRGAHAGCGGAARELILLRRGNRDLISALDRHAPQAFFTCRRVVAERAAIFGDLVPIGATELSPAFRLDHPRAAVPAAGAFAVAVGVGERLLLAGFAFRVEAVGRDRHVLVAFAEAEFLGV